MLDEPKTASRVQGDRCRSSVCVPTCRWGCRIFSQGLVRRKELVNRAAAMLCDPNIIRLIKHDAKWREDRLGRRELTNRMIRHVEHSYSVGVRLSNP